jgi:hypothetical protein
MHSLCKKIPKNIHYGVVSVDEVCEEVEAGAPYQPLRRNHIIIFGRMMPFVYLICKICLALFISNQKDETFLLALFRHRMKIPSQFLITTQPVHHYTVHHQL